jgi:hypothetical protein
MASKRKQEKAGMSRGRFLGFLGKIGLISFITGLPALAQRGDKPKPSDLPESTCRLDMCEGQKPFAGGDGKPKFKRRVRSPVINGRELSEKALFAPLATPELERLRSYVTGQFYEKVGERFAGNHIDTSHLGPETTGILDCLVATTYIPPDLITDIGSMGGLMGGWGDITEGHCQGKGCSSGMGCSGDGGFVCDDMWCSDFDCGGNTCWDLDCSGDEFGCKGDHCNGHNDKDIWNDLTEFTEDVFVEEITDILATTDIAVLKDELIKIMGSPEVINLNYEHFINGASRRR